MTRPHFILTLFLLALTRLTIACSCIGQTSVESGFKKSDIILVGQVLKMTYIEVVDSTDYILFKSDSPTVNKWLYTSKIANYTILVNKTFKGKTNTDTISILTGLGHGDCGFKFNVGDKYIIYGNTKTYLGQQDKYVHLNNKNTFWTNICSRTVAFNKDEFDALTLLCREK